MSDEASFKLHGTLTVGEMARFQYFHLLRRAWPFAGAVALGLIGVVFFLIGIALTGQFSELYPDLVTSSPFFLLMLFWGFMFGFNPYRIARKQFRDQPHLRELITYEFSSANIKGSGPSASWVVAWNVVKNVQETKSLFIVYYSKIQGVIVPKRMFGSSTELKAWRDLFVSCAPSGKIQRPGIVGRWC